MKKYTSNLLFTIFIVIFIFYIHNNRKDLTELLNFNLTSLLMLSIFFILSYVVKAKINQNLYLTKNIQISFIETLELIIKSTAGNLSTPLNLGTGYKFHYLKKNYNLTYKENLSINIYFSIFINLVYVLLLISISLTNYIRGRSIFLNLTILWLLIFFTGLFLFLILYKDYKMKWFNFFNTYSLKSLNLRFRNIVNLFILSSLLILISILSYWYVFRLIDLEIDNLQIVAYVCFLGLANIIKFTPGNFGINETVLIVSGLYHGITALDVIIVSIIFRFFSWINILIFTFFLYVQKSYNKKDK